MSDRRWKGTYEDLQRRVVAAEKALDYLADHHHRTLTNSRLHNPERIESYRDCPCLTCRRASAVLSAREEGTA